MSETVHVTSEELTASEVLEILDRGGRVVIDVDVFAGSRQATVRETDGTYYCDTTTKLLRHETADGLLTCLEKHRLVERPGSEDRSLTA
ncbi:MAG: hypothetical protein V5A55_00590 [Halovenus sp.]